jgi:GNAT superfamily N-acetyltransferase
MLSNRYDRAQYRRTGTAPTSRALLVRHLEPADVGAAADVVRGVFEEYAFTWDPDGYCSDMSDPLAHYDAFWVADDGGSVVGCVGLCFHRLVPGDPGTTAELDGEVRVAATDCELVRLYVASSARGRGLGARMTETVISAARAAEGTALELWSDKKLVHAHAMYVRLGAQLVGERTCPGDPDGSPEWGFRIEL